MQRAREAYDGLVDMVVRPARAQYGLLHLVGAEAGRFRIAGRAGRRRDFVLRGRSGGDLCCSLYSLEDAEGGGGGEGGAGGRDEGGRGPPASPPCVVYLHGNCGCRADANDVVRLLLPAGIQVCCFDFTACGHSPGAYVTLGSHEPKDLATVVEFLRNTGVGQIALWGRSMGAVTTIRYVHTCSDHSVAAIVADSPFSSLPALMHQLSSDRSAVPGFLLSFGLSLMRRTILQRAGFDINEVDTLESARGCHVPALLAHGLDDSLIPPAHADRIHACYAGDCRLMTFPGDHNDVRPIDFYHAARQLLVRSLAGGLKTAASLFEGLPSDPDRAPRSPGSRSPLNQMDSDRAVEFNRLSSARATNDSHASCKAYPDDWGHTGEEAPQKGPEEEEGQGEQEEQEEKKPRGESPPGPARAASEEGEGCNLVGDGGGDGGGGGGGKSEAGITPPSGKPRLWVPERDGLCEEDCPPRPV